MKLIIDIPDKMYETVQNGTYCGTLYENLKNGTPLSESEDCISRQAALDAVCEGLCGCKMSDCEYLFADCSEIEKIKQLPPVKLTEKVGHWIIYDVHGHKACKCSECDMDVGYPCNDKFCKYCGSRMQEGE